MLSAALFVLTGVLLLPGDADVPPRACNTSWYTSVVAHSKEKKKIYSEWIPLGSDEYKSGNTCAVFVARLNSDEMKGIERRRGKSGIEFRRRHASVANFPDKVSLVVELLGCQLPGTSPGVSDYDIFLPKGNRAPPPAELKNLAFIVTAVSPSARRQLAVATVKMNVESFSENHIPQVWYHFPIATKDIPITDLIEVEVRLPEGKPLACIRGGL